MKIAVVVSKFPTVSETFVINQIIYLLDKGHEVTILAYRKGDFAKIHQAVTDYGLLDKCLYFEKASPNRLNRFTQLVKLLLNAKTVNWSVFFKVFRNPKAWLNLKSAIYAQWFLVNDFDLIHIHWAHNAKVVALLKENKIINIPYFVTFHGSDIQPNLLNNYKSDYEQVLKHLSSVLVNTEYTKGLATNLVSEDRILILPVSLDTLKFKKDENLKKSNDFKILFCGRLIKLKGPDIALMILNDLVNNKKCQNIKLTIIGEGDFRQDLIEIIQLYELKDYVELLGEMTQEEVLEQMSLCDVFVLPGIHEPITHRAETQGLVIQEAQSMGLPVVVSDAGGMKYGLVDGETGFVVRENDIKGFSDKIEYLYRNSTIREEMGIRARKFAVENYDIKILGEKLEKIFYNQLNSSSLN